MQQKEPIKPKAKEKNAPKNKSLWQNRDTKKRKIPKKAIYAAEQTQGHGRKVNFEKLSQRIKQWKAKQIRHSYPASRENIESLKNSPLTLGSGFFSNFQKKPINTR